MLAGKHVRCYYAVMLLVNLKPNDLLLSNRTACALIQSRYVLPSEPSSG
jgi:hypothetical protein